MDSRTLATWVNAMYNAVGNESNTIGRSIPSSAAMTRNTPTTRPPNKKKLCYS